MEFKEQQNCDQDYNVENNCDDDEQNLDDITCSFFVEMLDQGGNGTDESDCIDEAEQDSIEQHQQE